MKKFLTFSFLVLSLSSITGIKTAFVLHASSANTPSDSPPSYEDVLSEDSPHGYNRLHDFYLPQVTGYTQAQIQDLIETFAPILKMHPKDKYFPQDVNTFLKQSYLVCFTDEKEKTISLLDLKPSTGEILKAITEDLQAGVPEKGKFCRLILKDKKSGLKGAVPGPDKIIHVPIYVGVQAMEDKHLEFQFWAFFPNNGPIKLLKPLVIGNHEGDWEHISIIVGPKKGREQSQFSTKNYEIKNVFYSAHQQAMGKRRYPGQFEEFKGHPVVYVGAGGHPMYSKKFRLNGRLDTTGKGAVWHTKDHYEIISANKLSKGLSLAEAKKKLFSFVDWLPFMGRYGATRQGSGGTIAQYSDHIVLKGGASMHDLNGKKTIQDASGKRVEVTIRKNLFANSPDGPFFRLATRGIIEKPAIGTLFGLAPGKPFYINLGPKGSKAFPYERPARLMNFLCVNFFKADTKNKRPIDESALITHSVPDFEIKQANKIFGKHVLYSSSKKDPNETYTIDGKTYQHCFPVPKTKNGNPANKLSLVLKWLNPSKQKSRINYLGGFSLVGFEYYANCDNLQCFKTPNPY